MSWGPANPAEAAEHQAKIDSVLDRARKIGAAHGGRKQHIIPASYLNRWAEGGKVRVTEPDTKRTYLGRPEKVGFETDFYRLEIDGVDKDEVPPLALEVFLSDVEGAAKLGIDELLDTGSLGENGGYLAWFIALQATRGRAFRETSRAHATELVKLRPQDLGEQDLKERGRSGRTGQGPGGGRRPDDGPVTAHCGVEVSTAPPTDTVLAALAAQASTRVVEELHERHWVVYDTPAVLMTCDEPVVTLGGPAGLRAERAGFGVAPVIVFPLAPTKLLVLLRGDLAPELRRELDHVETADVNRELVAASTRWMFERPSRHSARRFQVPAPANAVQMRAWAATDEERRAASQSHQLTRWANAPHQPWPVTRWWETCGYR